MKASPKITSAVNEVKYLSVDNHSRYRLIMRLFYINYERINYWLNVLDVYEGVKDNISGYTIEDCKLDLESLVEWGNLINDQDTERIFTIQDFKNKKFRYQMSEYSVEIERLMVKLENMNVEGASLDIGLIGSIRLQISQLRSMPLADNEELYSWWRSLNESFRRLNREYQDYMKCFSFFRKEDNSNARQFILRKDDIIKYLRSFVKGIQKNGVIIAKELSECKDISNTVLERIIDYECSIPRINAEASRADISENVHALYSNIYSWFAAEQSSEMERIMDITNNVIRNLTSYAAILAENSDSAASRSSEYKLFAKMFTNCESTEDAHRLSALLFGLPNTCHICAASERTTESISSGIYDEAPDELIIKPRVVTYREKQRHSAVRNRSAEKEKTYREYLDRANRLQAKIDTLITDGKITIENLPVVDSQTRSVLLNWISRAFAQNNRCKTEYNREFTLIYPDNGKKCVLHCTDGDLLMPAFILDFGEQP